MLLPGEIYTLKPRDGDYTGDPGPRLSADLGDGETKIWE
jgi:hypothetical protein